LLATWSDGDLFSYFPGRSADTLASLGHVLRDTTCYTMMPFSLVADFARDRNGLPNFRFS